jgi:hypothetical protein
MHRLTSRPSRAAYSAALVLLLAGAGASRAATIPFSDNFNSDTPGSTAGFTEFSGGNTSTTAFVVSTPAATFNNDSVFNNATSAAMQFTNSGTGVNFVEKVTVTPTAVGSSLANNFYGLGALGTSADLTNADPIQANNTFYLADVQGSSAIRILRVVNGTATSIVSGTYAGTLAIGTAETLTLTGTYSGGSLTLSFNVTDGVNSTTITAPVEAAPLTGQFFGIRNRNANPSGANATATEDNFSVVPEPASCTLAAIPALAALLRRRRRRTE